MSKENLTAYVYDSLFLEHDMPGHPENSNRLISIIQALHNVGLLEKMKSIPIRKATDDELLLCHSESLIAEIKGDTGILEGQIGPDVYKNISSWDCARAAVGSLIDLCKMVAENRANNGFAFVRPPGHHAIKNRAMGFCLFNNVAIAANYLLKNNLVQKIAIVDFDVHHGNGTQALTEDNPNILFVSSHQFPFYPGTGSKTEIGRNKGKGSVVNIPLPFSSGDKNLKKAYNEIAFPAVRKFKPDFILVSAGFDAHWMDPLAQLNITSSGYSWLTHNLVELSKEICNGKIVFSLEGGYDLEALSETIKNATRALLGNTIYEDSFDNPDISENNIDELIAELKTIHGL